MFDFRKTTMSTSFDIGRVVLLLFTRLSKLIVILNSSDCLNSFDFIIQNKTAGKNGCCLVAYCITYQVYKHLSTGVSWIGNCKTHSN